MKLEDSLSFKKAIKLVDFINALSIWKSSQNTHLNTKVRTTDFLPATIAVQSTLPEKVVCSALLCKGLHRPSVPSPVLVQWPREADGHQAVCVAL